MGRSRSGMCAWRSGAACGMGARGQVCDRPHADTSAPLAAGAHGVAEQRVLRHDALGGHQRGLRTQVCDRTHADSSAPWRQARTEWLSNVSFAMTRWEGSNAKVPLVERLQHLLLGFAQVKHPDHAASRGTKTAPVSVSRIVSRVRVEQGWDKMYRDFCQTPGNTLSMQARLRC